MVSDSSRELSPRHSDTTAIDTVNKIESKESVASSSTGLLTSSQESRSIDKTDATDKIEKITIRFKPIGSTPSLNPKIFKISSGSNVQVVVKFLCNKLHLQTVHLYVSNSFQPNPDENLGDLYRLFSTNGELVINYCNTIAFG